jgi:hypothetical protein
MTSNKRNNKERYEHGDGSGETHHVGERKRDDFSELTAGRHECRVGDGLSIRKCDGMYQAGST